LHLALGVSPFQQFADCGCHWFWQRTQIRVSMRKQGSVRVNYSGLVLPAVPQKYDSGNLLVSDGKKIVLKSLHRNCAAVFNLGIRVRLFNKATNSLW
jgi:hypothetical protein